MYVHIYRLYTQWESINCVSIYNQQKKINNLKKKKKKKLYTSYIHNT